MTETARQRFIRNFGEADSLFAIRIEEARRANDPSLDALVKMRQTWQEIYQKACFEEGDHP